MPLGDVCVCVCAGAGIKNRRRRGGLRREKEDFLKPLSTCEFLRNWLTPMIVGWLTDDESNDPSL
jgi:hypothetical protein